MSRGKSHLWHSRWHFKKKKSIQKSIKTFRWTNSHQRIQTSSKDDHQMIVITFDGCFESTSWGIITRIIWDEVLNGGRQESHLRVLFWSPMCICNRKIIVIGRDAETLSNEQDDHHIILGVKIEGHAPPPFTRISASVIFSHPNPPFLTPSCLPHQKSVSELCLEERMRMMSYQIQMILNHHHALFLCHQIIWLRFVLFILAHDSHQNHHERVYPNPMQFFISPLLLLPLFQSGSYSSGNSNLITIISCDPFHIHKRKRRVSKNGYHDDSPDHQRDHHQDSEREWETPLEYQYQYYHQHHNDGSGKKERRMRGRMN